MTIEIKQVDWNLANQAISNLRKEVFVIEQGVSEDGEWDEEDRRNETAHFLATLDDIPVAYTRVLADGKIGRLCVKNNVRNQGIGSQIFREAMVYAITSQNLNTVYLHGQVQACELYERFGFVQEGEMFSEANIDHFKMVFRPSSQESLERLFEDRVIRLHSPFEFSQHAQLITRVALRELTLFTQNLPLEIYGEAFSRELSQFIRNQRNARARIIVADNATLLGRSHPLVLLAQRLPSLLSIRVLHTDIDPGDTSFCCADSRQLVYFNNEAMLEGFVNYKAPAEAQNCLESFENLWNKHSSADPNLARLSL